MRRNRDSSVASSSSRISEELDAQDALFDNDEDINSDDDGSSNRGTLLYNFNASVQSEKETSQNFVCTSKVALLKCRAKHS